MSNLLTCRVHHDSDASSAPTENGRVALAMPTYYLIIVPLTHKRRLLLFSTLVAKQSSLRPLAPEPTAAKEWSRVVFPDYSYLNL